MQQQQRQATRMQQQQRQAPRIQQQQRQATRMQQRRQALMHFPVQLGPPGHGAGPPSYRALRARACDSVAAQSERSRSRTAGPPSHHPGESGAERAEFRAAPTRPGRGALPAASSRIPPIHRARRPNPIHRARRPTPIHCARRRPPIH
jgi:hypothetical protein